MRIMNSFKRNLFAIVAFLSAIIGGLLILLNRKSNQNADLKSDKDLTVQREKSTIVDSKVESAQKEIDKLEKEMKTKPKDDDDFWKDYTK
jgi:preprotein translocase subunit SecF